MIKTEENSSSLSIIKYLNNLILYIHFIYTFLIFSFDNCNKKSLSNVRRGMNYSLFYYF